MAEQTKGKYGALSEVKQRPATEEPGEAAAPQTEIFLPMKAYKPQGKRSDPDWKQFSVLLKKESHKQAGIILRQKYDGVDISDLMQALLEHWLKTA